MFFYYSTNSDLTHLWEVVDVAKERLVGSSSCSNPGASGSLYGGQLSTGRKAQRVVKASSTAPVITHSSERPRSAHHEDAMKNKGTSGLLGIEDAFDKAISLPTSPVSKELPYDIEIRKHETKKAQRRHHTHHLFDGILHTISGGTNDETKTKTFSQTFEQNQTNQNTSSVEFSESSETSNIVTYEIDRSRWQHNKTQDTDSKVNTSGTPVGLIRRWSETTSPTAKSAQSKQPKVI